MSLSAVAICLIACHAGPADHFASFAEKLVTEGYEVEVYASGPALKKFQDRNIKVICPFEIEGLSESKELELADQIAKRCSKAAVVLTDVGHSFDVTLQTAISLQAPEVLRVAYYDNPEPYVPGGYSKVASKVMNLAQKVLFANANLKEEVLYQDLNKEIQLPRKNRIGLGYYPISGAEKISARREQDQDSMRAKLFSKHGLKENNQKILVYFGGNNEEYFKEAFPAFLSFLSYKDLSNVVIVMQQHPGAKVKNLDRQELETWVKNQGSFAKAPKIVFSDETTDDMQVVADAALYYQTSMGPLFALAGIPTIQVGHKTYEDILVRSHLAPSVTSQVDFMKAIESITPIKVSEEKRLLIFERLGIRDDWFDLFKKTLMDSESESIETCFSRAIITLEKASSCFFKDFLRINFFDKSIERENRV